MDYTGVFVTLQTRAGSMLIAFASSTGQQCDDENALETLKGPHYCIHALIENAFKAMKRGTISHPMPIFTYKSMAWIFQLRLRLCLLCFR